MTPRCAEAFADTFTDACDQRDSLSKKSERVKLVAMMVSFFGGRQPAISWSRNVRHHSRTRDSCEFFYERRLLPCVSSRNSLVDATSKALALILLMFAPTVVALRAFCSCVRSVSFDQGDERKIPQQTGIADDGVCFIKGKSVNPLLPCTISELYLSYFWSPGCRHAWDGMIRKGLSLLLWFLSWLASLKHLVAWFRHENCGFEGSARWCGR